MKNDTIIRLNKAEQQREILRGYWNLQPSEQLKEKMIKNQEEIDALNKELKD